MYIPRNPNKLRICEYLMRYHEERGDKVIVFSDSVYALAKYAQVGGEGVFLCMYVYIYICMCVYAQGWEWTCVYSLHHLSAHPKTHLPTPMTKPTQQLFGRDAIYGGTKESERERLLAAFRISSRVNTIFLSRVCIY